MCPSRAPGADRAVDSDLAVAGMVGLPAGRWGESGLRTRSRRARGPWSLRDALAASSSAREYDAFPTSRARPCRLAGPTARLCARSRPIASTEAGKRCRKRSSAQRDRCQGRVFLGPRSSQRGQDFSRPRQVRARRSLPGQSLPRTTLNEARSGLLSAPARSTLRVAWNRRPSPIWPIPSTGGRGTRPHRQDLDCAPAFTTPGVRLRPPRLITGRPLFLVGLGPARPG